MFLQYYIRQRLLEVEAELFLMSLVESTGGAEKGEREKVVRCHGDQIHRASQCVATVGSCMTGLCFSVEKKHSVPLHIQSCKIKRLSSDV